MTWKPTSRDLEMEWDLRYLEKVSVVLMPDHGWQERVMQTKQMKYVGLCAWGRLILSGWGTSEKGKSPIPSGIPEAPGAQQYFES